MAGAAISIGTRGSPKMRAPIYAARPIEPIWGEESKVEQVL
jgi:hypothetical protein